MNIARPLSEIVDAAAARGGRDVLAGLMVDASGRPMTLDPLTAARPRHYVSVGEAERIDAKRVGRNAVQVLRRLYLMDESDDRLPSLLRRIVVCPDCLVFQLDRRACIGHWRGQGRLPSRIAKDDLLRVISGWLPDGYAVADVGWVLCLTLPRRSRARRVRPDR